MNRLDDEVAQSTNGYVAPRRVNTGWISESWSLFRAQADVWLSVVAVSVFAPLLFNVFVSYAYGLSSKYAGTETGNVWSTFHHLPPGLKIGLTLLNLIYVVFVTCGIHTLALRQIAGNAVSFSDFYSGGPLFGRMLVFMVIYSVIVGAGLVLVIVPGIFAAAMLLPAFALIADGETVSGAMSRSFKAMHYDRASALSVTFLLFLLLIASAIPFGLGLMVTAPMAWLISSLALRDMIGLRSRLSVVDIDFVPQDHRGQVLVPEIDESVMNAAYGYGRAGNTPEGDSGDAGSPRTLGGDAIDGSDAASPPAA